MASQVVKPYYLRNVIVRNYASQPKASPVTSSSNLDIISTSLPNKLTVASIENCSPISRVSVLFRAGSRNETPENLGASHVLRIAAGLGTSGCSSLAIMRNVQKVGANLSATVDRETVSYTLEGTRDAVDETWHVLADVAAKQCFKPWELSDSIPRLQYELAGLSPQVLVVDMLHKAAFRSGLGNSLYCPKHHVGKLSSETMLHYMCSNFTTNRAAVAGLGIDHDDLVAFAQNLSLESGPGTDVASKYFGGELRHETGGALAHVALATEGATLKNEKEAFAFGVLQHIMGIGPYTKYGTEAHSSLSKAVSSAVSNSPYAVSALNAQYTDNGLFGVVISAPANVIGKALESAAKELQKGTVSAEDVARGKIQLKVAVLSTLESGNALIDEIGHQALLLGNTKNISQIISAIDSVSANDVTAAAKKIASGKFSLAAVGNLSSVPYVDQLK